MEGEFNLNLQDQGMESNSSSSAQQEKLPCQSSFNGGSGHQHSQSMMTGGEQSHQRSHTPNNLSSLVSASGGNSSFANNLYSNSKDNVKVVIRVRPLNEREKQSGGHRKCVTVENATSIALEGYKPFNFDYVADEDVPQKVIFDQIAKPIADCCLEGYNGTIFAYGQTGSGKTFTIQGPSNQLPSGEEVIFCSNKKSARGENQRGIMQRSFEYIFDSLESERTAEKCGAQDGYQFEYLIRCSYLEIYNEQIMDLLEPQSVNLHIREDIKKGVYVEGLQEEVVFSAEDMMRLIQIGVKNRHVGSHSMNKESSRSHSVLTTIIETKSMKEGGVWNIKTSRFHIIDLAGSERSKQTNAVGERLKEAGMINKSLSALGNVINSLVDISEGKSRHVHYRDSKLTFLLRDSLGGNSKTLIIANASPSNACHGETLSTLKFAQRAKLIKNKAVINEDSSGTIQLLKAEIGRLKKEIAESEKAMKELQSGTSTDCLRCKALLLYNDGQTNVREDDEMLVSFEGSLQESPEQKLKKKLKINEIAALTKRVQHLEGLLSANLETLSTQQRYYESEVQKWQQQAKRAQQTVETFEKQNARDKMIIKFREERINKLEQNGRHDENQEIADLKKEVALWKEAADHNTQAAKLFAEKSELQNKLEQLKIEVKHTPESLSAQIRSLTEFNESLNQYLKQYCEESKIELEKELQQIKEEYSEKLDSFNIKFQQQEQEHQQTLIHKEALFQETIQTLKAQMKLMEAQFADEKFELDRLNQEMISQLKHESGTSEQQLRVSLLQKEQQLESEIEKKHDIERAFASEVAELNAQLKEQQRLFEEQGKELIKMTEKVGNGEALLEKERKNHIEVLKVVEIRWEQKVKELEQEVLEYSSEKESLAEQYDDAISQMQALTTTNEKLQNALVEKEEILLKIQERLNTKEQFIEKLTSSHDQLEVFLSNMRSKIKLTDIQSQQRVSEMQQQLSQLAEQLQLVNNEKDELASQLQSLQQENHCLKEQVETLTVQSENEIAQLRVDISEQEKKNDILMEEYVKALNEERQTAMHEKLNLQSENDKLQTIINKKDDIIASLNQKIQEKEQSLLNFKEEIQTLTQNHEKARIHGEELHKERIHQLELEISSEKQLVEQKLIQVGESFKQEISKMKNEYEFKMSQMGQSTELFEVQRIEYQRQITDIQQQLKHAIEDKDTTISQIQENQRQIIEQIEQHVLKLQHDKDNDDKAYEEERVSFKQQIEQLTLSYEQKLFELQKEKAQESEKFEQEKLSLLSEISTLNISLNSQKQQVENAFTKTQEQLKQQLQQKHLEIIQRDQHITKMSNALSESQSKLVNYHQESSRLAAQLDQSLKQKNSLLEEIENARREIQKLTLDSNHKSSEIKQVKQQKKTITKQNEDICEELLKNKALIQDYEAKVISLQEQLEFKISETSLLEEQLKQHSQEAELTLRNTRNENERQSLLKGKEIEEKTQMITKLQNEIESLKEQALLLQNSNQQLKHETEELKQQRDEKSSADEFYQKLKMQQDEYKDQLDKLQQELGKKEEQVKSVNASLEKQKKLNKDQESMLRSCQDTISQMRDQQTQLQGEFKQKIQSIQDREDKLKRQMLDTREDRERSRKECDNLKDLVKMKDKQIEDYLASDERDRSALEKISKESKELRAQLLTREQEMQKMARTMKFYFEENSRLKQDNEKLAKENDQLIGHKNPSQKIQHHVRIKEENNRLKEENLRLQDELRRMIDIIAKQRPSIKESPGDQDAEPRRLHQQLASPINEPHSQQALSILIDHLYSQPSLQKMIPLINNDENATEKVKRAIEAITILNEQMTTRDTKLRNLERDVRKYEQLLQISEKERVMSQQQQRQMINSPLLTLQTASSNTMNGNILPLSVKNISSSSGLNKENLVSIQTLAYQQQLNQQKSQPKMNIPNQNIQGTFPGAQIIQQQHINHRVREASSSEGAGSLMNHGIAVSAASIPPKQAGVRTGSTKRLVSGAAAAFINVGNQSSGAASMSANASAASLQLPSDKQR